MGSLYRKSPQGYSGTHFHTTTGKNCIANCGQTVPDTAVVCIDNVWEQIPSPTQQYHRRPPRGIPSKKGVVKKCRASAALKGKIRSTSLSALHEDSSDVATVGCRRLVSNHKTKYITNETNNPGYCVELLKTLQPSAFYSRLKTNPRTLPPSYFWFHLVCVHGSWTWTGLSGSGH